MPRPNPGGIWEISPMLSGATPQRNGYSVVEEIGGHGIGLEFHEEPFVSYVTPKGSEMVLVPGHDVYHRTYDQ